MVSFSKFNSFTAQFSSNESFTDRIKRYVKTTKLDANNDVVIKILEDSALFAVSMYCAESGASRACAIASYVKHLLGNKSVASQVTTIITDLVEFFKSEPVVPVAEAQSLNQFEDIVSAARYLLDNFGKFGDKPLFQRLYKVIGYIISMKFFTELGEGIIPMRQFFCVTEGQWKNNMFGIDFLHSVCELIVFACEQGIQCIKLKSWQPLIHSGTTYEKWALRAQVIISQADWLNNPEAHGIVLPLFIKELENLILEGDSIMKLADGKYEKKFILSYLLRLRTVQRTITASDAALKMRAAPHGVLIAGASGIGKSSFSNIIIDHVGKLLGLPIGDEYIYVRNPTEKHWNNFRSYHWGVVVDDAGYMSPSMGEIDESILEILQIINNIAFVPQQASVDDKGKTPMRCRLAIFTTNTMHLNLKAYFSCPFAAMRRFPIVLDLRPKEEFLAEDGQSLNTKGLEPKEGEYMNYWHITCYKPVPLRIKRNGDDRENQGFGFKKINAFDDIYDFLEWHAHKVLEHEATQKNFLLSKEYTKQIQLCMKCYRPVKKCNCADFFKFVEDNLEEKESEEIIVMDESQADEEYLLNVDRILKGVHLFSYRHQKVNETLNSMHRAPMDQFISSVKITWWAWIFQYLSVALAWLAAATVNNQVLYAITIWIVWFWIVIFAFFFSKNAYIVRRLYFLLGLFNYYKTMTHKNQHIVKTIVALGGASIALWGFVRVLSANKRSDPIVKDEEPSEEESIPISKPEAKMNAEAYTIEELNTMGTTPQPRGFERPNSWPRNSFQLSVQDLSPQILSWKDMSPNQFESILLKNSWRGTIILEEGLYRVKTHTMLFAVCDFIYMVNAHAIPETRFTLEMRREPDASITTNHTVNIDPDQVYRAGNDVAFIRVHRIDPARNLVNLFADKTIDTPFNANYIGVDKQLGPFRRQLVNCVRKKMECVEFPSKVDGYVALTREATSIGDCGAPMYIRTSMGYIILGIHSMGTPGATMYEVGIASVTKSMIQLAIDHFKHLVINPAPIKLEHPEHGIGLAPVHYKSVVNYIENGEAKVITGIAEAKGSPQSKVERTMVYDYMIKMGKSTKFTKPSKMKSWEPWHLGTKSRIAKRIGFDESEIMAASDSFLKDILRKLPRSEIQFFKADLETAINGADGVAHIYSMKKNTSMGFPWRKIKRSYMVLKENGKYDFTDPIKDEILREINEYIESNMVNPIFDANLKDEPISLSKDEIGKIRVFTGAPAAWSTVVRMYFLWAVRMIQNNPIVFETGAAMNLMSDEWNSVHKYLAEHPLNKMIAGDFKEFDTTILAFLIMRAFHILIQLARLGGATPEDIRVMYGISVDTSFNIIDMKGTLLRFMGGVPSGHPLTLIINSLVNSIYMRCVYARLNPKGGCTTFQDDVHLLTMGDDNMMSVRYGIDWFNHTSISKIFAQVGITYTMADKNAESIPFIDIKNVEFCKRSFRWEPCTGTYLAPLLEASIWRPFFYQDRSSVLSKEAAVIESVANAMREFFFYGSETYYEQMFDMIKLVHDNNLWHYLTPTTFRTYEYWRRDYLSKCDNDTQDSCLLYCGLNGEVALKRKLQEAKLPMPHIVTVGGSITVLGQPRVDVGTSSPERSSKSLFKEGYGWDPEDTVTFDRCESESIRILKKWTNKNTKNQRLISQSINGDKPSVPREQIIKRALQKALNDKERMSKPPRCIDKQYEERFWHAQSETEVEETVVEATTIDFHITNDAGYSTVPGSMRRIYDTPSDTIDLTKFLSRPLLIDTSTISTSGDAFGNSYELNPWYLFFNNPLVQAKTNNYAFIRCELEIMVVVNASPFLPGAYLFSYNPLQDTVTNPKTFFGPPIPASANYSEIILLSQCPHLWVLPHEQKGGNMTLPFLFHKNWLSLDNLANYSPTGVNTTEFKQMGVLRCTTVAPLTSANGQSGTITINTFCWAKNVELAGASALMTFQSERTIEKKKGSNRSDEYGETGTISGPASAVAALAGWFTKAPIIGPFATATQMGAKAIAAGAASIGYTNVPVIDDVIPVRNVVTAGFANSERGFPTEKLTLDPKNELTIDNAAIGGTSVDELNLNSLITRESYIMNVQWKGTNAEGTTLMANVIHPTAYNFPEINGAATATMYYTTPLTHFSQMFQFWRGDIILRFKIVASQYHKGRIKISWDPSGDTANNIITSDPMNAVFSHIIDISQTTDFEVRVPYLQTTEWCKVVPYSSSTSYLQQTSFSFIRTDGTTNGMLTMRVINELTSPAANASTTAYILMFARAADNFEFAGPAPQFGVTANRYTMWTPQSETEVEIKKYDMDKPSVPNPARYLTNFGEGIVSLRQVLRRTSFLANDFFFMQNSSLTTFQLNVQRMPRTYGYDPFGLNTGNKQIAGGTAPASFTALHPITWVTSCFSGVKGSINYYFTFNNVGTNDIYSLVANRYPVQPGTSSNNSIVLHQLVATTDTNILSNYLAENAMDGSQGMALTNVSTTPTLAVVAPNYTQYLFNGTSLYNTSASSQYDGAANDMITVNATLDSRFTVSNTYPSVSTYCGIGADFNVINFLHTPVVYVLVSRITPT